MGDQGVSHLHKKSVSNQRHLVCAGLVACGFVPFLESIG